MSSSVMVVAAAAAAVLRKMIFDRGAGRDEIGWKKGGAVGGQ